MDNTKDYIKRRRSKLKALRKEEKKVNRDKQEDVEGDKALANAPPVIDLAVWKAQILTFDKQDAESFWPGIAPPKYSADLSLDDVVYKTPTQAIDEAVSNAAQDVQSRPLPATLDTQALMTKYEPKIPKEDDLIKAREQAPLHTIRHFKVWKDAGNKLPGGQGTGEEDSETLERMVEDEGAMGDERAASDEILIRVAIYHHSRNIRMQEMVFLGSQPLTALKDAITCESDRDELIDPSNPCPGSFFFIDETFYIDTRNPQNIDYSVPIMKWISEGAAPNWAKFLKEIKKEKMETLSMQQLKLRMGWPYLYLHRANCEHTIIFTEVRAMTDTDARTKAMYPVILFNHKFRIRKCSICENYTARFVTIGDERAPESPCFFCPFCYHSLHYDKDGALLYKFEVYPYYSE